MSETELSVICKNCGSEVSPYVTECPYCGARLRKRAPKLERRGDALEAQRPRRRRRRLLPRSRPHFARNDVARPYATITVILGSAILLIVQKATGYGLISFGGVIVPIENDWWRYLTAPFAYSDIGYLFVVSLGLAIFATGVERRLGTAPTAVLLLACGALGVLAAAGIAEAQGEFTVIAGGNGMALGAVAAWFAIRRAETHGAIDEEYDMIGVAVAAVVLIALPIFAPTADFFSCLVGGAVGGLAGLAASALHSSDR
ncbi:MAG TPA: rhomboid family intramembrane serine protease [Solirubrobacterales bacterium]|nr:rhomboid family intramembrane serine protease [Solirubrobacterales bacterium]